MTISDKERALWEAVEQVIGDVCSMQGDDFIDLEKFCKTQLIIELAKLPKDGLNEAK